MNARGATEVEACDQVARIEYPDDCSGCNPMRSPMPYSPPSPDLPPAAIHCGIQTCTLIAWETLAGGYTCGDRISWLMETQGRQEVQACEQVAHFEFPNECGGCDPTMRIETSRPPPSRPPPSPPPSSPPPAPRCGTTTCTSAVWATLAGAFSCGARITWLREVQLLDERAACARVASVEYPNECGGCEPDGGG